MMRRCEHLCKSRSFVCLLVCCIQVCVSTKSRWKDVSNDLREAIVAAHQSEKGHKVISKRMSPSFYSKKHFSQVDNIQDCCQSAQEWTSRQVHPKVRLSNAQRNWEKQKRYHSGDDSSTFGENQMQHIGTNTSYQLYQKRLMIWACFAAIALEHPESTMNSSVYQNRQGSNVRPCVWLLKPDLN